MALTKLSSSEIQTGAITADKISGDVALSMRIANVSIANSTYTVLDDTAVNVGGGYIVVTGAGFQSGAQVIINETPATSTTFVSSTELRAQVGAKSAATYDVYVINPDGGNAISVNGITYSSSPTWVTGSTLDAQNVDVAFNVSFSATGATSYANTTALPAGTTLLSNGYFYGTVTGIGSETTYNFTISAIDNENQNSDREFSLTVAVVTAPSTVEYLVVAGGGGSTKYDFNNHGQGGGGAGGYLSGNLSITTSTTYDVIVGGGGSASNYWPGTNGANSSLGLSITAIGGGYGGTSANFTYRNGALGGSGGGAAGSPDGGSGGPGTPGQGNNGGNGAASPGRGGGGGGAGAAGSSAAPNAGGAGGAGLQWSDGNYYAGGGAGGASSPSMVIASASGGIGGGGTGARFNDAYGPNSAAGTDGTTNTGGGAGGGANGLGGYNGGSGVVIVRYADTYADAASTTGSPTFTNTGGYKTYKFTGSGSITW